MAIPHQKSIFDPRDPREPSNGFDIDVQDVAIGGKLVTASYTIAEYERIKFDSDETFRKFTKQTIVQELARYMVDSKLVEVTAQHNMAEGTVMIKARAYVAPDSQVKLLRTAYAKKN